MSTDPALYEIEAMIDHRSRGVGCFDPVQVVFRMRVVFPELIEDLRSQLVSTAESMLRNCDPDAKGALRTAAYDLWERGPTIAFEIPWNGKVFKGVAERYWVRVSASEPFPDEFRCRFVEFLNGLFLQPIQVREEKV